MQPDQDEKFALNCEFGNYFIFSPTADLAVRAVLQVSCAAVDCGSARPLNTLRYYVAPIAATVVKLFYVHTCRFWKSQPR